MNKANGKWSRKYSKCMVCKTTKNKYHANGMCRNCYKKKWQKENPEKMKKYFEKYREENIEKTKIGSRNWAKNNPERIKRLGEEYRKNNREKERKRNKKYREENPEKIKKSLILWRKNNSERIKKYAKEYSLNKRSNNLHYKLRMNISRSINHRLKSRLLSKNKKSTWDFLPYTVDDLIQHLEKLFQPGMTWSNYGYYGWHIDHRIADCKFNYKSVEDKKFQECWALENLQPLWAEDNLRKGEK